MAKQEKVMDYLFGFFFIIAAITTICWYNAKLKLKEERAVFQDKMQVLIESNKQQELKLQAAYKQKDSVANYYSGRLDEARKKQEQIKNDFKPLYNEINTSPDSAQYSIFKRLLAGYAKLSGN